MLSELRDKRASPSHGLSPHHRGGSPDAGGTGGGEGPARRRQHLRRRGRELGGRGPPRAARNRRLTLREHPGKGFDRDRDGRKGDNVIDAIEREAKVLADKAQPREKRVEALKFVVHLVADLHQPLHCADRNGDKGGNGRLVFFLDRKKADSLHYVWDTALVREMIGERPVAQAQSKAISAKQRTEGAAGAPEQWANVSHQVAVENVYATVPADGPPPKLTKADVAKATPVVTEQIERAGVRLAMVLNTALK